MAGTKWSDQVLVAPWEEATRGSKSLDLELHEWGEEGCAFRTAGATSHLVRLLTRSRTHGRTSYATALGGDCASSTNHLMFNYMPPRTTRKSYRLRASDRTMVGTLQPHCLSHQKPKASSRQQHDSAEKENPKSLPTLHGLESQAKTFAPSSRRGVFSLDSPLYRTPLPSM